MEVSVRKIAALIERRNSAFFGVTSLCPPEEFTTRMVRLALGFLNGVGIKMKGNYPFNSLA